MNHPFFKTLIGSFGKGVKNSVTVNFGVSGGVNCSDTCPLKNNGCYACNVEKMKPSITVNLEKKQDNFSEYLTALNSEKSIDKLNKSPWIRFSAFGSIPAISKIKKADREKFKALAASIENHQKIHFPVETLAKYNFLKSAGFNPRLSLSEKTSGLKNHIAKDRLISIVVAGKKMATGKNKRANSQKAFDTMRELNKQGIKTKVCPAIPANAECGSCTLCANPEIKVIIYPKHT